MWGRVLTGTIAAALALALMPVANAPAATTFPTPAWTTYHHDSLRTGFDPDSSTPVAPHHAWQSATLDGQIYAEPLVLGNTVYIATENNSVYALNASTGKVVWQQNAGTAVPANSLPCGDIGPTLGITGTPVLDPATDGIYAVADVYSGGHAHHMLVAYNLSTGAPLFTPRDVDYGGGSSPQFIPENQLQRAALSLDGREIVIGFGGNDGDCAHYHGWLIALSDTGTGQVTGYQAGPNSDNGDAIWGGGGGPVVDSAGAIYATTGNGFSNTTYDYGDSIIKLDPSLHVLDHYAPSIWAQDNATDADLGSENAVYLPGGLLFQSGKDGNGYLVRAGTGKMGGTGVAGKRDPAAYLAAICGPGGWGGPAYHNGTIYAPCGFPTGGGGSLLALSYDKAKPSFSTLWTAPDDVTSSPIVAGGLVWVASIANSVVYGLDPATGQVKYQASVPSINNFSTPSAGGGRLFIGTGQTVNAYIISTLPRPIVKLTSPANGATVTSSTVTVTGTVSDTVSITKLSVNGWDAQRSGLNWTATVRGLKPGMNTLTATAVDGAAISAATSVTVDYVP